MGKCPVTYTTGLTSRVARGGMEKNMDTTASFGSMWGLP